ncbi:hypothetical protein LS74_000245 [Helicobacter magdeburgensis]|uniref:Uncharacterized protein n=1 Tax=Helicobacter magdeburgensis TaxID=471858 RepID=A0A4U8T5E4_9HELI|nr:MULTISPECIES: hypothetical protein [Helicobacter]TLD93817.1 hypothetical protein LS74_000245 [Helicobacter magdeburgensis]BDB65268.1 hypothetical protein T36_1744 [Helicobacter cinaedi]
MVKVNVGAETHFFFQTEKEMRDFAKSIGLKIVRYAKEKYFVDYADSDCFYTAYKTKHFNGVMDWVKGNYAIYKHYVKKS